MDGILDFIIKNITFVSTFASIACYFLVLWLSKGFVTRKEFNQQCKNAHERHELYKEERVEISKKILEISNTQSKHEIVLKELPKQKDLHSIEKLLVEIQGDNKAHTEKMDAMEGSFKNLSNQVGMVFDHLLNNK